MPPVHLFKYFLLCFKTPKKVSNKWVDCHFALSIDWIRSFEQFQMFDAFFQRPGESVHINKKIYEINWNSISNSIHVILWIKLDEICTWWICCRICTIYGCYLPRIYETRQSKIYCTPRAAFCWRFENRRKMFVVFNVMNFYKEYVSEKSPKFIHPVHTSEHATFFSEIRTSWDEINFIYFSQIWCKYENLTSIYNRNTL